MELVVVLAIIAILAAIITPMITSYIARARISSAQNDVRNLAAGIIAFANDTRVWPIYQDASDIPSGDVFEALETDGDVAVDATPAGGNLWNVGSNGSLTAFLNQNFLNLATTGNRAWNGAYVNDIRADPWGTKYYFNGRFLKPGITETAVFVISAGPDKEIDTDFNQNVASFTLGDDDIVQRIR